MASLVWGWQGEGQLLKPGVAVEKLISAKIAKMKSRQEAIFSNRKTFSIPQILPFENEKRVFPYAALYNPR
jgi:hypothetical protein